MVTFTQLVFDKGSMKKCSLSVCCRSVVAVTEMPEGSQVVLSNGHSFHVEESREAVLEKLQPTTCERAVLHHEASEQPAE